MSSKSSLKPCGTPAAYLRHKRRGEEPCEPCRKARRDYQRAAPPRSKNPKPRQRTEQTCGTRSGYDRHRYRREEPCEPCREANREYLRTYNYRTDSEHYASMLKDQNGLCAICHQPEENEKALAVDHDHSCCPGRRSCGDCVRSLLCTRCNTLIGRFRDDSDLLASAADYLRRWTS